MLLTAAVLTFAACAACSGIVLTGMFSQSSAAADASGNLLAAHAGNGLAVLLVD
jgi:hypothetical protein